MFSRPEVIRRVNAEFVPCAMRAPLVNGMVPAGDEREAKLYERMNRTKIAPQGICVLSPAGRVLAWVETFEDEAAILAFLDHCLDLCKAKDPLPAERFMLYPGRRIEDIAAEDSSPIEGRHKDGERCPAASLSHACGPKGSLVCRLYGRALDEEGKASGDTVRQESYAHDEFLLDPDVLAELVHALENADDGALVTDHVAHVLALNAYLGHIDVRPLENPRQGTGEAKECEFHAFKEHGGLWRIEGHTDVIGEVPDGGQGDGASCSHTVQLEWKGFLEAEGGRVTRLLLYARGTESLRWRNRQASQGAEEGRSETAFLPAGRAIDFSGKVAYGIIGEPIRDDQVGTPPGGGPPESLQKKMHRLQELLQEWQKAGKDPGPVVGKVMERFEPIIRQGKFADAEKVLDEAIKLLEGDSPSK